MWRVSDALGRGRADRSRLSRLWLWNRACGEHERWEYTIGAIEDVAFHWFWSLVWNHPDRLSTQTFILHLKSLIGHQTQSSGKGAGLDLHPRDEAPYPPEWDPSYDQSPLEPVSVWEPGTCHHACMNWWSLPTSATGNTLSVLVSFCVSLLELSQTSKSFSYSSVPFGGSG